MLSKQTPCYAIVIAIIKVDSIISVFMGFCGMFFRISCMNSFFCYMESIHSTLQAKSYLCDFFSIIVLLGYIKNVLYLILMPSLLSVA